MTLLRSLFTANLESPQIPVSSPEVLKLFGPGATLAGPVVSEKSSLGMPAVWRAVNLIAGSIASLPLHPYRSDGDTRTRVLTGRAADLLAKPHPDMTPYELWETVLTHVLLWGNGYLRIVRDSLGTIRELWVIHPARVKAGRASDGTKVYAVDGGKHAWTDDEVLHLPGFGYDGVCGVSPIRVARQGIGLALAAEEYGARLFGSGSLASGVLQTDARLSSDQADAVQARWEAKRAGLEGAHKVIVLDSGVKFTQLTIPPEDAQFLQSRSFQVSEVARMFGVPPHMLMDTDKSTSWGTGIEQQTLGWVVFTLRSWLTRIEQRVTRILAPEPVYARYSIEGLLRGDSTARASYYRQMWEVGAFSTNEIRGLEEMGPVDGGDARYVPLNFGELGDSALADPQTEPVDPSGPVSPGRVKEPYG